MSRAAEYFFQPKNRLRIEFKDDQGNFKIEVASLLQRPSRVGSDEVPTLQSDHF